VALEVELEVGVKNNQIATIGLDQICEFALVSSFSGYCVA